MVGLIVVGTGAWLALHKAAPAPTPSPTTLPAAPTTATEAPAAPTTTPEPTPDSPVAAQLAKLEGADARLRAEAAQELAHMGPAGREAIPALVKALDDRDAHVAEQAAMALGEFRDRSAVAPLVGVLERASRESTAPLARAAVRALGRLGGSRKDPVIANALLVAAQTAADPAVRAEAASQTANLGADSPGVAAALAAVAERDTDEKVRKAAADAADRLDPTVRRRLAVANLVQKGQEASKEGHLVDPREDSALALAVKALGADPQSQEARSLHEQTIEAIRTTVRAAAKSDTQKATRILEQAIAIDPGRPELEELRTSVAEAKQEADRRARTFRLVHKHSSKAFLGGVIAVGDGKTRGCRGTLEILDDGFRFKTERSDDSRTDNVEFHSAQIRLVEIRENGDQLHIETVSGRYDFYGASSDLRRIQQALTK